MQYHTNRTIGANWSKTAKFSHDSKMYVIQYTGFAPNIDKFIEMYPTFTIETSGEAKSKETFGDVGHGHFGNRQFQTSLFNCTDFSQQLLVSSYKNNLMFDAGVQIGVELKRDNKKLYLIPFVNGWIYSVGARWRELSLSFNLTKITFHPK